MNNLILLKKKLDASSPNPTKEVWAVSKVDPKFIYSNLNRIAYANNGIELNSFQDSHYTYTYRGMNKFLSTNQL